MLVLNELKNRGVKDILIASVDGLVGFNEAIRAVYPNTEIQRCIIHQIRNSSKYLSYKDLKAFNADLKLVYTASTEEVALAELDRLEENGEKNT
nr:transposase [Clostridium septicum]